MKKTNRTNALVNLIQGILLTVALAATAAAAEGVSAPNELMKKLDMLKGTWVGDAKGTGPDGKPYQVRQTERVGAMLNGDVLVIEGRGYKSDGSLAFNAFGTVAADVKTGAYEFHAYTQGRSGTFRMESIPTGVVWELPAGPNATMRYTIDRSRGLGVFGSVASGEISQSTSTAVDTAVSSCADTFMYAETTDDAR